MTTEAERLIDLTGFRFKGLTKGEKYIVLKYLRFKDLTMQDIAQRLNTSPQLINYYMKKLEIK